MEPTFMEMFTMTILAIPAVLALVRLAWMVVLAEWRFMRKPDSKYGCSETNRVRWEL